VISSSSYEFTCAKQPFSFSVISPFPSYSQSMLAFGAAPSSKGLFRPSLWAVSYSSNYYFEFHGLLYIGHSLSGIFFLFFHVFHLLPSTYPILDIFP
jgi:hypothetical protein